MVRFGLGRLFALSWVLLGCSASCTSLVAAGRTGRVLDSQQLRASVGTVAGLTSRKAKWWGYRTVGETRGEWRLSVPIGFAVDWRVDPPKRATPMLVIALIPELTLASKHLAPELDADGITRVSQFWAIFLTIRCELEVWLS